MDGLCLGCAWMINVDYDGLFMDCVRIMDGVLRVDDAWIMLGLCIHYSWILFELCV